jgi:hypothetical protein
MKKWLFWIGNSLLVVIAIVSLIASIWSMIVPNPYRWYIRGSQGFPYVLTLDSLSLTLEHWSGKSSGSFKFSIYVPMIFLLSAILPIYELMWWRERIQLRKKRLALGLCIHCGYDVRMTPGLCPECGKNPKA